MLCSNAVRAYDSFGRFNGSEQQRGFLVNYESLPGAVARLLLPSFGIEPNEHWLTRMAAESKQYSKSRGSVAKLFLGDSEDKEERATQGIQKVSKLILEPTFDQMEKISADGLRAVSPSLFAKMSAGGEVSWQMLKDVPVTPSHDVPLAPRKSVSAAGAGVATPVKGLGLDLVAVDPLADSQRSAGGAGGARGAEGGANLRGKHSSFTKKEFVPWAPFSNSHSSRPYEVSNAP
jgi:hypothetical protein